MATRFRRLRAYFPVKACAPGACGHSHLVCLAIKLITLFVIGCGALSIGVSTSRANTFVEFDFNIYSKTNRARGTWFVELFDDRPITVANFLQYVNTNLYNGALMQNLSVSPGVLRGGAYYPNYVSEPSPLVVTSLNPAVKVDLDLNPATANPTIQGEFNNAPLRSNLKGTLSMYHPVINDPNGASNEFFFNLIDNAQFLDGGTGYTVFGKIIGDGTSLLDIYANSTALLNLNPDVNDDGTREAGPFGQVPAAIDQASGTFLPLILTKAKVVDYLGNGLVTDVPAGGLTIAARDMFLDTGTTFTGTGSITIGTNRTLGIRENYILNRPVINHGTLAPGLSLGVVGIQGSYLQYSDGILGIQLAGTTVDTLYDRVISTSTAYLAGRLQVSLLSGFMPVAGNSFTVLSAQSIVGNFTSYDLPVLTAGLVWNIDTTATAVILTVADADFNKDGIVDGRDYVYWRKTNGTPAQYQSWRDNLGNRSGGIFLAGSSGGGGGLNAGNVPEPSCGFLAAACSLLWAVNDRRWMSRRRRAA